MKLNLIFILFYKKMRLKPFYLNIIIFMIIFQLSYSINIANIDINKTSYYEEKYFRILSNNYEYNTIAQGNKWNNLNEGIGFEARKDFGSLILLKDWSMYNFKLTKVVFRNKCVFIFKDDPKCIEMWLIHTKDNGYFSPGRRIFIKQNHLTIVIPFLVTDELNPSIDSIFEFLRMDEFTPGKFDNISPKKPIKLFQIIQNQPSLLIEGKYKDDKMLFMIFTQYHFISEKHFTKINDTLNVTFFNDCIEYDYDDVNETTIYRNVKNVNDVKPKVSLMIYSKSYYLKNIFLLLVIFLF